MDHPSALRVGTRQPDRELMAHDYCLVTERGIGYRFNLPVERFGFD